MHVSEELTSARATAHRRDLAVAATMTVAIALALAWSSTYAGSGMPTYVLDDAYIHLAIARNLAENGTWGLWPGEFASAASSLAWPLLLAAVGRMVGVVPVLAFALNLVFGLATLALFAHWLRQVRAPGILRLPLHLALVFAVPIPVMAMVGMEHLLHLFLAALFVTLVALDLGRPGGGVPTAVIGLVATCLVAARYEGAFLVVAACLFWFAVARWRPALVVGALSVLPVVSYAIYSTAQGWEPVPNSVLLRSGIPLVKAGSGAIGGWVGLLHNIGRVEFLGPLGLTLALAWLVRRHRSPWLIAGALFAANLAFHLSLSLVGEFYRYDAYLYGLGVFALGGLTGAVPRLAAASSFRRTMRSAPRMVVAAAIVALAAVAAGSVGLRSARAHHYTPGVAERRFCEQYQTARFLAEHYGGQTVLLHDIGMPAFFGGVRILDLFGLASLEPIEYRRGPGGYAADDVTSWLAAEGAEIGIVSHQWSFVPPHIPASWVEAGAWRMELSPVGKVVTFYGIDARSADDLQRRLREFASSLPACVAPVFLAELAPGEISGI